jgi:hypothetical protein
MIIDMLKISPRFQEMNEERQEIFAKLADEFEDNDVALYLDASELAKKLNVGNRALWQEFLNFEPVRQYINAQMSNAAQVAMRKSMQGLVAQGMGGNVQAAKELKEMAGFLGNGDTNKVVVLHQISRPKVVRKDASL